MPSQVRTIPNKTGHPYGPHDEIVEISTPARSAAPESAPNSELSNAFFMNFMKVVGDVSTCVDDREQAYVDQ